MTAKNPHARFRVANGAPADERIAHAIQFIDGCWEWTRAKQRAGYGILCVGRKVHLAHRYAYLNLVGPIAKGLELDHLCRNKLCVNPDHLEEVTRSENVRRGWQHRTLGTGLVGELNPRARVSNAQAREIRERYSRGDKLQRELAAEYGIAQITVSRIVRGERHA